MRNSKYLLFFSAAVFAAPALAQDAERGEIVFADFRIPDAEITVTATGSETRLVDTGQPVTVIARDEIESVQGADLTRVLERAPGVTFSRNGGVGSFTGVRVRGADAEQLLVMVDEVRVNDPASPAGGFDFGNLLSGNIQSIELLRGANSTIWGADAMGGVMEVVTRREAGLTAAAEYGSDETVFATATAGLGGSDGFIGVSGSYFTTDGYSAAASGTEPDGFEQWAMSARGNLRVAGAVEVFANGRYSKGDLDLDGYPWPDYILSDTPESQETTQYSGSAGVRYQGNALDLVASYGFADTERANFDSTYGSSDPTYTADGHSDRLALRGQIQPGGYVVANLGGEYEWTSFESLYDARQSTRIAGAYGQIGVETPTIAAHIGLRHDDHRDFGGATSLGADASYTFARGWRVRASYGEGFKTPTLFQLLSDYGNDALQPETSRSYDIAIERGVRGAPLHAAVTVFRRDSRNLIDYVSCWGVTDGICTDRPFGTYDNVARARAQGLEFELGAQVSANFAASAVYTYVETENRTANALNEGNWLARRPRHALTTSVDWTSPMGFTLGADLRLVGHSFDDAGNYTRLDGYETIDLRASMPLGEKFEIYGRMQNLFDADYQTAAGYNTQGRAAYIGARLKL